MEIRNENQTPWIATHPGTILRYELQERGISQKDFAAMIDMQKSHLNELIKGKGPMTKNIAAKIEKALGISAISLVNMQTQYDFDIKEIGKREIEELQAQNDLALYNEIFDVKTLFKRIDEKITDLRQQVSYIMQTLKLPQPAELKLETAGMFRKSAKTGQDPRMLMTWKLLAENKAKAQKTGHAFKAENKDKLVAALVSALHHNQGTEDKVKSILAEAGIAFCIEEKVENASIDGYSFIENGTPYIILTKRFNRIDNFAFALMHELGHIYLHYIDGNKQDSKLSIPDYDNESKEEKEANAFAANALIPEKEWQKAPQVRVNPITIQHKYTQWAIEKGYNKWIVLGRVSYEIGMYKFRPDESRKIN